MTTTNNALGSGLTGPLQFRAEVCNCRGRLIEENRDGS